MIGLLRAVIALLEVAGVLLLIRLGVRVLAQAFATATRPVARPTTQVPAREMVRDRVCNTYVPRDRALVERLQGREEFFCSAACRDRARDELRRAS